MLLLLLLLSLLLGETLARTLEAAGIMQPQPELLLLLPLPFLTGHVSTTGTWHDTWYTAYVTYKQHATRLPRASGKDS